MIKISAVSYLNSIPFIYGLKNSKLIDTIDLRLDHPAACAEELINGNVDLALVPVVVIPNLEYAYIISDYCIGANGPVDTVCLYSDVPINEIRSVDLDYESRTSVALLKVLLKEYWNLNIELNNSKVGFEQNIGGSNAALVIGDRAFNLTNKHPYVYDLSAIWKEMTGFPFVFAAWVANKILPDDFINTFNISLQDGLRNIDQALDQEKDSYPHCKSPIDYLNNKISYNLDAEKLAGMDLFLKKI